MESLTSKKRVIRFLTLSVTMMGEEGQIFAIIVYS